MKFLVIDGDNDTSEFGTEEEVKAYIEEHSQTPDEAGRWNETWQSNIRIFQICREVKFNVDFKTVVTLGE